MSRRFAVASLLFAWLCANGALLDAMQVAAWARMFAGYSGTMTVSAALAQTFDPAKPCPMCRGIAKAKETARQQLPPAREDDTGRFVLALHSAEPPVFADHRSRWEAGPPGCPRERTDPVPRPPPRA